MELPLEKDCDGHHEDRRGYLAIEDEDEAVESVVHCCLVDNEHAGDDDPYDDGHYVRLFPVVHFDLVYR
jgi:hypothetical protein